MTSELTRAEVEELGERLEMWPKSRVMELFDMTPGERDVIGLLVVHLDARPVDEDGWPIKDSHYE